MSSRSKQTAQPAAAPTRSSSRLRLPGTRGSSATEPAAPAARTRNTRNAAASAPQDVPPPAHKASGLIKSVAASASRRVLASRNDPIQPPPTAADVDSPTPSTPTEGKGKLSLGAFLRIRPSPSETSAYSPYLTVLTDNSVLMTDPSSSQNQPSLRRLTNSSPPSSSVYSFTHIFPPETSQSNFFKEAALPLVQDLLSGENGLIFAYGVTNSGKTYTVQGGKEPGQAGLLPRTVDAVFNSIQGKISNAPLRPVRLSSVEFDPSATAANHTAFDIPTSDEVLAELLPDHTATADGDHDTSGLFTSPRLEIISAPTLELEVDEQYEYAVWVSFVEIYNEKIYDLLGGNEEAGQQLDRTNSKQRLPSSSSGGTISRSKAFTSLLGNRISTMVSSFSLTHQLTSALTSSSSGTPVVTRKALSLRTDSSSLRNGKYVAGLNEIRVRSAEEAKKVIQMGQINRRVFGTLANKQSSRSHAVFSIRMIRVKKGADVQKDPSAVHTSRLSFVDLAGSERHKNTQSAGDRLKEAGSINKSLMVLGQCLEVMRNNQKRMARGSSYGENVAPRPDNKATIVPFWYSKLTELFQDYFEGDGKAVMIVNVNPYDTGFDENSHVMKFAALARDVTTNVAQNKAPVGVVIAPTMAPKAPPKIPPARRTVSIVVAPKDGPSKETLWEVAEEEEDEPEEPRDDLVDQLFDIIEELKSKLYDAELRFAMAEIEIREEVTREFEERIQEMEANFTKRRAEDEEENEAKMDRKIDLLYKAGLLGGQRGGVSGADFQEEDDVDTSLIVDEEEEEAEDETDREISPSPPEAKRRTIKSERVSDASLGSELATEGSTVASDSETNDASQLEEAEGASESDGTATDGEWLPPPKTPGNQVIHSDPESEDEDKSSANHISSVPKSSEKTKGKAIDRQSDVLKVSKNARSSGGKKTPRLVPLPSHDVSVVYTPVIRPKGRDSERLSDESDDSEPHNMHGVTGTEGEGNLEAPIVKKKKRFEKSGSPRSDIHPLD
ncbi:hypothetical protein M407DRAFT_22898 [Tulasnella calospora MUT 4182]|uniref:Kinesin motor domain-containing protein n=1 Tax=Tulasnella calospora MUT 4182 TaxID=1051891 RepID=A0A0C3L289_9AGAM|nr:hypothetical protein M407DRAFT_22898 [Tulasnella calospora MUT 4182]